MEYTIRIIAEFWNLLCEMAPYLLFGFAIAGILSVLISPKTVEKHLGGRGFLPVFKAALFGVPLPLCSCGVIPVAASLRRHGASKGATTAFLISTPQTGVDSILVTLGMLGPLFAIFRPIAALLTGIIGGVAVDLADSKNDNTQAETCTDECCNHKAKSPKLLRAIRYSFIVLPRDIAKPLLIGLAVSGLIAVLIPDNFFTAILGTGIFSMLVMMAVGIPIYVCATASVPIAAVMIMKGISPGAALVFLMTGPATNAAAIATIWKTMGRQTALIYLTVVAVTSLACGLLLDYFFTISKVTPKTVSMWMLPHWAEMMSAVILLGLLLWPLFENNKKHSHGEIRADGQ